MTEHDEQVAYFEWCEWMRAKHPQLRWAHAIPNGGHRHKATAINLVREGVKRGVADVCLPYPCGGYHGLYIEFKYGKNKLTFEQAEFLNYASSVGYKTSVAYSSDEAIEITENYLRGE